MFRAVTLLDCDFVNVLFQFTLTYRLGPAGFLSYIGFDLVRLSFRISLGWTIIGA